MEEFLIFSLDDLDVKVSGFSLDDCLSCYKDVLVNKKFGSVSLMKVISHVKSLSSSTGFIKERSITYLEGGELFNYGLIIKERLESALGNLCLIRSVGGVPEFSEKLPVWIFEYIS